VYYLKTKIIPKMQE